MLGRHLDRDRLERFLSLELRRNELREAVWHLSRCERCRRILAGMAPQALDLLTLFTRGATLPEAGEPGDYEAAIAAARRVALSRAAVLEEDRRRAPELLAELMKLPPRRWRHRVARDPRCHCFGLAELLVAESRRCWSEDNDRAELLGQLAIEVLERLGERRTGDERALLQDLRADAWGAIAVARRVASDLRGADAAIARACDHLRRGTGEPLVRARLLTQTASIRTSQRRFDEAERLLARVIAIYRRVGDAHLEGRALISLANAQSYRGDAETAIATLAQALPRIDAARDPRLLQAAKHNLMSGLIEVGRPREALALLPAVRALTRRSGKRLDAVRLEWLEGQLAAELGREREAEEKLRSARAKFIAEKIGYDAALVSLDLAALHLAAGRLDAVKRLAAEMVPIFQSRDVHREAVAALSLFQQAAAAETLSGAMLRDLTSYLGKARNDPRLRFERPS